MEYEKNFLFISRDKKATCCVECALEKHGTFEKSILPLFPFAQPYFLKCTRRILVGFFPVFQVQLKYFRERKKLYFKCTGVYVFVYFRKI